MRRLTDDAGQGPQIPNAARNGHERLAPTSLLAPTKESSVIAMAQSTHRTGSDVSPKALPNGFATVMNENAVKDPSPSASTRPPMTKWTGRSLLEEDSIMDEPPVQDDPQEIGKTMDNLNESISGAVSILMQQLDLRQYQPLSLDLDIHHPDKVSTLMCSLLGTEREDFQQKAREFFSSQNQQSVTLHSFIHSVVGKAVTNWSLLPNLLPQSFWSDLGRGAVVDGLATGKNLSNTGNIATNTFTAAGPKQGAKVKVAITQRYLDNTVRPTIFGRAACMASDVDQMLKFFIPRLKLEHDPRREIENASYTILHPGLIPSKSTLSGTSAGCRILPLFSELL